MDLSGYSFASSWASVVLVGVSSRRSTAPFSVSHPFPMFISSHDMASFSFHVMATDSQTYISYHMSLHEPALRDPNCQKKVASVQEGTLLEIDTIHSSIFLRTPLIPSSLQVCPRNLSPPRTPFYLGRFLPWKCHRLRVLVTKPNTRWRHRRPSKGDNMMHLDPGSCGHEGCHGGMDQVFAQAMSYLSLWDRCSMTPSSSTQYSGFIIRWYSYC